MSNEEVIDGVLIDKENLRRTAEHSRTHNQMNRDLSTDEIEMFILQNALDKVKQPNFCLGQMEPIYDVWFVCDEFPMGTLFNSEPALSNPPHRYINFFVRLGRLDLA